MSLLDDQRENVTSVLTEAFEDFGVSTFDTWPDTLISPPAVIVIPGSPYVRREDTDAWGHLTVRLRVVLIAPKAPNSVQSNGLDALIETAIIALLNEGIGVEEVEQPGEMTVGNSVYLATFIRITTQINLH